MTFLPPGEDKRSAPNWTNDHRGDGGGAGENSGERRRFLETDFIFPAFIHKTTNYSSEQ